MQSTVQPYYALCQKPMNEVRVLIFLWLDKFFTGFERNFRKYSHGQVDRLGAPYDVTSVMHVPRRSWSRNGRNTIESRAGAHVVLGQQRGLSVVDKQQLNQLYNCGGKKGRTLFKPLCLKCLQ